MNGRFLNKLFFGFNQFSTDTELNAGQVEDVVCIGIGHDENRPSFFQLGDERVRASTQCAAVISPSNQQVLIKRPGGAGMYVIGTKTNVLWEQYEKITGENPRHTIGFDPSADLTKSQGKLLREVVGTLATVADNAQEGRKPDLLVPILEDTLISLILSLSGYSRQALEEICQPAAPWVVRRAEEYMATHVGDPITMSDLITVCGTSRRAIYYAFKSCREYTPLQFLASRRLEIARERLVQEHDSTVTQISLECGFSNHGRFAKAYRSRFGETPSETLVKHHGPTND